MLYKFYIFVLINCITISFIFVLISDCIYLYSPRMWYELYVNCWYIHVKLQWIYLIARSFIFAPTFPLFNKFFLHSSVFLTVSFYYKHCRIWCRICSTGVCRNAITYFRPYAIHIPSTPCSASPPPPAILFDEHSRLLHFAKITQFPN